MSFVVDDLGYAYVRDDGSWTWVASDATRSSSGYATAEVALRDGPRLTPPYADVVGSSIHDGWIAGHRQRPFVV